MNVPIIWVRPNRVGLAHPPHRRPNMNIKLIELLKEIENLSDEDLEKIMAWAEFTLDKRRDNYE